MTYKDGRWKELYQGFDISGGEPSDYINRNVFVLSVSAAFFTKQRHKEEKICY
jgi:hypothetical protein